jgi:hypothetical protein
MGYRRRELRRIDIRNVDRNANGATTAIRLLQAGKSAHNQDAMNLSSVAR